MRSERQYIIDEKRAFLSFHYSKTCVKQPHSKRPKIGHQDQLSLNADQKYCKMLQGEHSAILSTFNKLPFVFKIFVLSIFEWLFYTGFTVHSRNVLFSRTTFLEQTVPTRIRPLLYPTIESYCSLGNRVNQNHTVH